MYTFVDLTLKNLQGKEKWLYSQFFCPYWPVKKKKSINRISGKKNKRPRNQNKIMSSRYDSRTTTFSPEGRLYQVEYAVEAISQAGTVIGILTTEGVVLATEKRVPSNLLDAEVVEDKNISGDKVFKIADHLCCAVAGITSDANTLLHLLVSQHTVTNTRTVSRWQRKIFAACSAIPSKGTRSTVVCPLASFLIAGWDRFHGFQLYHTDPSGNYNAWKAYAAGQNDQVAQGLLKTEWKPDLPP